MLLLLLFSNIVGFFIFITQLWWHIWEASTSLYVRCEAPIFDCSLVFILFFSMNNNNSNSKVLLSHQSKDAQSWYHSHYSRCLSGICWAWRSCWRCSSLSASPTRYCSPPEIEKQQFREVVAPGITRRWGPSSRKRRDLKWRAILPK